MQVTDEMEKARDNWLAEVGRKRCFDLDEGFKAGYTAALSKAEPVGVGVKIKPLEWSVYGGDAYAFSGVTQKAYSISFEEGKYWAAWDATLASFGTLNEAKAAAQADYEQRILSAISLPCKENGETVTPSQQLAVGRWLPIAQADRSICQIQDFPTVGITLRNSARYWVRDEDGRTYEASWTERNEGRSYWWDWEGESPVDPVEFMPHPLDPKYAATEADHDPA